jgi:hypothetical protein
MPAPGEPLWGDEDRAWALALLQVESEGCPDCGHPWAESSHADNEFAYQAELVRCHACATSIKARDAYEAQQGDVRGLHVSITRRQ